MSEAIRVLERSAAAVNAWGQSRLSDGRTLEDLLSVNSVSTWQVAAPTLALHPVARAISMKSELPSLFQRVRPYLSRIRQVVDDSLTGKRKGTGQVAWPRGSTWLFLGFSPYMYRDALEPVVSHLRADSQPIQPVTICDHNGSPIVAGSHGTGDHSIWQHWTMSVAEDAKAMRRLLLKAERELYARGLPRAIEDEGALSWRQAEPVFTWFFRAFLPRVVPQIAIAQLLLRKYRPALIITPDIADPRTRIYSLVGRSLGIPTLELQLGVYGADGVEWQFSLGNKVAVWGESAVTVLSQHGVPKDRLVITGSPRYDWLANSSDTEAERTRRRLGAPEGKPVVLFASTYSIRAYNAVANADVMEAVKKAIFRTADELDGLCLVVKPHPVENIAAIRQMGKGSADTIVADPREDIRQLIAACDAFITLGSTSTMDALVARKLVIYPDFPGLVWWDDMFLNGKVTVQASSQEALTQALKSVIDGKHEELLSQLEPARQDFLGKWVFKPDGNAAARIVALGRQLTRSN